MISENLELLQKLDLEAWKDIIFPIKNCLVEVPRNPLEQGIYEALVQAGVQRAIEKNGTAWDISARIEGYAAIIYDPVHGHWCGMEHSFRSETYGDSPADALLAAFIEAIR